MSVEVVRSIYDALTKGDVPGALAKFHPRIEWIEEAGFPTAGTYVGPEAVLKNVLEKLGADPWDGFRVTAEEFIGDGSSVVALGWYAGRHKHTGKAFRARFAHVWRVRDGKAVGFEQVADSGAVLQSFSG